MSEYLHDDTMNPYRQVDQSNDLNRSPFACDERDSDALPIREEYGRDARPISVALLEGSAEEHVEVFRNLFLRALNDNQRFLLEHINGDKKSLNKLLNHLSDRYEKPVSTLKLNARILKDLYLIDYGCRDDPVPVTLTSYGKMIRDIITIDYEEVKDR